MNGKQLLVLGVATLAAGGCGGSERAAERAMEDAMREGGAADADVDLSQDRVRITAENEGRTTVVEMAGDEDLDLPDGFPDDVPVFPRSRVAYSVTAEDEGLATTLRTAEGAEEVYEYYLEHLVEEGWQIDQKMEAGGMFIVHATKAERELAVSISDDGDGSLINLALAVS